MLILPLERLIYRFPVMFVLKFYFLSQCFENGDEFLSRCASLICDAGSKEA